ncbi:MAG: fimbrial protein [Thiobacillus sp. 63-78]|uniref:PilN domain-containing protein n=1 Tax=Thiobacillus sp. 63-78 TaxID=1895859 RepID=UPI0009635ECE|nr:PilN domain-containing protein [Thiobacillus sp. 63-78]MBN8762450.1 PilN domain-containing protein [Thiobacillus sp.]MBN8773784.1 PilN domain-containing protein [Thiobacillus sp.]OJZ15948.1 MAG: fimbrial protein [Thiobacillus sp. 63-78]
MIRINLLPHRELARAARRRQFNILLGIAVATGVLVVVLGHSVIAARQSTQDARNAYLDQEITRLDGQIGEIKKIREQTQALLERKQVVETLQSNRTEVVHLFDQMIRLLPDGLYLKSFKQAGGIVTISGFTQSSARVSTLMRNLDSSPWFESAALVEIKAATVNNLRANEFVLTVKQTPQQADDANDKGGKA